MGTGRMDAAKLRAMLKEITCVSGDYAEVGVWRGDNFKTLVKAASAAGRMAHAFDSFTGMAAPGAMDDGDYPAGKFDVGGPAAFSTLMGAAGVDPTAYRLWPGYVLDCFAGFDQPLSFAYIDLDHYAPTAQALQFFWPLLQSGGVLGLDDYNSTWPQCAAAAITRWLREAKPESVQLSLENDQLFLRKL